jgi:hypothetical protein
MSNHKGRTAEEVVGRLISGPFAICEEIGLGFLPAAGTPARTRSTGVGRLHRRPYRTDGSPRHRGIHGARFLHRRPVHLGPAKAGRRPRRRGRGAQPSGYRPEMPDLSYNNNMKGWGPELCARRPDITRAMVDAFLTNMCRARADFVYTVTRDFVRNCQTPILVLPDEVPGPPLRRRDGVRASGTQRAGEPLPVEGHSGQDPAGGAPHPHLPAGISAGGHRASTYRSCRSIRPVSK